MLLLYTCIFVLFFFLFLIIIIVIYSIIIICFSFTGDSGGWRRVTFPALLVIQHK